MEPDLPIDASGEKSKVKPDKGEAARSEALELLASNPKDRSPQRARSDVHASAQAPAEQVGSGNPSAVQQQYQYEALYANGRVRYSINRDGTTFGILQTTPDATGKYTETHYGHSNPSENFTATIVEKGNGTKLITYDNGGKRLVNKDGSGYIQSGRDRNGNYEVTVFGPGSAQKYKMNVVRTSDGATFYSYDNGSWRKVLPDGSKTESTPLANSKEREERQFDSSGRIRRIETIGEDQRRTVLKDVTEKDILTQLIDDKISRPEVRTIFRDAMSEFESRAQKDQLTDREVAATYREVSRLLEAEGAKGGHPDRLAALAGHVLRNAAYPEQISAGDHHTERVAAVEASIYKFHPSAAAKLVADVGINGSYSDLKHNYVKVDSTPHDSSVTFFPKDGERNHASEIFQVTAVNLALAERRLGRDIRIEYVQSNPEAPGREDTGERMLFRSLNGSVREVLDRGIPLREPRLTDDDIATLPSAISERTRLPYLTHLFNASGHSRDISRVMSLQELHETLTRQSKSSSDGELNTLAKVYSINEPFWSERQHKITDRPQAEREQTITITRFIPGDGSNWGFVEVNSHLGTSGVHEGRKAIPLEQLYRAMQTVDKNVPAIAREIRQTGGAAIDPLKHLDLIRLAMSERPITKRDEVEVADRLIDLTSRCKREGWSHEANASEQQRLISRFDDITLQLPTHLALQVVDQERLSGMLNDKEYDQRLAILAWQVRREQERDKVWDRRINNAENRRRLAEVYSYIRPLSEERRTAIQAKISEFLILYP